MPIQYRHFGVKTSAAALNQSGYTDHGILLVQNGSGSAAGQAGSPPDASGTIWQMGPDETRFDNIICYTKAAINDDSEGTLNTEGTKSTASYVPGDGSDTSDYPYNGAGRKLSFIGCSDADFLGVSQNLVPAENFTSGTQAANYFNNVAESAWTNYVSEGESPTPATSATTLATEATAATTRIDEGGEKGGGEPTYTYWNTTDCNGANPATFRYAGSNGLVANASVISLANQTAGVKQGNVAIIVEQTTQEAWTGPAAYSLSDPITASNCEGAGEGLGEGGQE